MTAEEIEEELRNVEFLALELLKQVASLRQAAHGPKAGAPAPALPIDLVPAAEAARIGRLSKTRIRALCASNLFCDGKGFAVKVGKRWFVSRRGFQKFINAR